MLGAKAPVPPPTAEHNGTGSNPFAGPPSVPFISQRSSYPLHAAAGSVNEADGPERRIIAEFISPLAPASISILVVVDFPASEWPTKSTPAPFRIAPAE